MKPHLDVDPQPPDDLPFSLTLELSVHDQDVIAELCGLPEGSTRDEFALKALRIGVFALRQARGQLDAEVIRRECNRLLSGMEGKLDEHAKTIHDRLGTRNWREMRSGIGFAKAATGLSTVLTMLPR